MPESDHHYIQVKFRHAAALLHHVIIMIAAPATRHLSQAGHESRLGVPGRGAVDSG